MSSSVRVRFAPSPTGMLHMGGARTALFCWLYARRTGGTFLLRVEDTDRERHSEAATGAIFGGLRWLGLDWDEGPERGGEFGPYYQSERNAIYERYFEQLDAAGHLYREPDGAVRFRSLRKVQVVDDAVCGRIEFDLSNPDTHPDMTIRRPDGSWIFHFVNVVDDIEMRITHVIRGEDHLSNTPKHLELYSALGAQPPCFAHIPLILNLDGTKMSKRDKGAAVHEYIEGGYAPEAVRNFLCLLGWSPKDDREKLDINEVIAHFDLQQINRKAARFDIQKCDWLNAQYLMHMPLERLVELAIPFAEKAGIPFESPARLGAALTLVREKLKHLTDLPKWIDYYFTDAFEIEAEAREKTLARDGVFDRLDALADAFSAVGNWTAPELETALKQLATGAGIKPAEYIHPARAAVSGRTYGASLYHMLEFLGRERVLARLGSARTRFAPPV